MRYNVGTLRKLLGSWLKTRRENSSKVEELFEEEDGTLKKEMVEKAEIEGTPFHMVKQPNGDVHILCGRVAISKPFTTFDEACTWLEKNPYDAILNLILGIHEMMTRRAEWEKKIDSMKQ